MDDAGCPRKHNFAAELGAKQRLREGKENQSVQRTHKKSQSNIPTKPNSVISKPPTVPLGGAAAVTGTSVVLGPFGLFTYCVAVATPYAVLVFATWTGMVSVTTLDPFVPHPAQLCVRIV